LQEQIHAGGAVEEKGEPGLGNGEGAKKEDGREEPGGEEGFGPRWEFK